MGSIVLYIIEWAFALLVLLAIYKAAFSGTTLYRFNRFYLLGATLLSALLPLVHVTIPDSTPLVSEMSIQETEFAQELSGTFMFVAEPEMPIAEPYIEEPASKSHLWPIMLVCAYAVYVLTLIIGWSRGVIRARRFLKGKPRRRLSRTVWLVTHNEAYGPFSWMNYIVISNTESGFARRASLRHEYSHVRLMHSIDLIILLACTIVNPVCWLVLQEIKIVHEYEADDEVINRYGIHEQDYQRLLVIRTVGAEAYALASSFNLNIKKRIIMMNKNKTRKRRLIWLLLLIPLLGMTSVLFARTENNLNLDLAGKTYSENGTIGITADGEELIISGRVVDEKGKPVADAMITEMPSQAPVVTFSFHCFTDKNGYFSFRTPDGKDYFCIAKEGYKVAKIMFNNIDSELSITLKSSEPGHETETGDDSPLFFVKNRNIMRVIVQEDGKVHVKNAVVDKKLSPGKLSDLVKQFVANPNNNSKLPIVEEYEIPGYKTVQTTIRHMISLEREPGASWDLRDAVHGIIANAYYELRDEWCRKEFGKAYDECTQEQQDYSRAMYATKILNSEMRYLCDLVIDVRKDALMAHVNRTDQKSGVQTDIKRELDFGRILKNANELEDYINNVIDVSSRLRSVKVRLHPGGSTDIITDIKKIIRKKSAAIGIKYESVQDDDEDYIIKEPAVVAQNSLSFVPDDDDDIKIDLDRNFVQHSEGEVFKELRLVISAEPLLFSPTIRTFRYANGQDILLSQTVLKEVSDMEELGTLLDQSPEISQVSRFRLAMSPDVPTGLAQLIKTMFRSKKLLNLIYESYDQQKAEEEIFKGKLPETVQYIQDNINYPDEAKQAPNSNVLVSFTAGKDGNVMNPEIIGSADLALDEEALKVLSQMPAWVPARNENGEAIEVKYTIPVSTPLPQDLK